MQHWYWARQCVFCGQGRLMIMKDLAQNELYLHCEECEWGWRDPEEAGGREGMFLTLSEPFDARPASIEEIRAADWTKYVVGHADED